MNGMIVYCEDPKRTVTAFAKAVGLYNPDTQTASLFGPKDLAAFRELVCEELEIRTTNYVDPDIVWIYSLPGAKMQDGQQPNPIGH